MHRIREGRRGFTVVEVLTLRILVVTNMYPPHHFGGYELSCRDAVRHFSRAGHEVLVLTSDIVVAGVGEGPQGSEPVRRELQMYWKDHRLLSPPLRQRLAIERQNQAALRRALSDWCPDVVSVWNMGALSLGLLTSLRRLHIPTVFVIADEWPTYAQRLDAWSRLFRGPIGWAVAGAVEGLGGLPARARDYGKDATCLFYSECMREAARQNSGWSLECSAVVHAGVDLSDFPIPSGAPSGRPWAWRLLYVGRIDERKGIDTALRALEQLPEARLRVVGRGDGAYLEHLRSLAVELRVEAQVEFAAVEREHLRPEYMAADVLIFPSVYKEPFGIVPLEAMACDTPVVATATGGSGEYLAHEVNCLLYPPGDRDSLVGAVRRLAGDAALRRRLVGGGRQTARRLSAHAFGEALLGWHEEAASRRSPPLQGGAAGELRAGL